MISGPPRSYCTPLPEIGFGERERVGDVIVDAVVVALHAYGLEDGHVVSLDLDARRVDVRLYLPWWRRILVTRSRVDRLVSYAQYLLTTASHALSVGLDVTLDVRVLRPGAVPPR